MPEVKKPQDHKAKSTKGPFTFDVGDKTYSLPPASEGAEHLSGRVLRDCALAGEAGELRLSFLMLEACGVDEETQDALYDQPASDTLNTIQRWMQHKGDDGVSVPQS